MPDDGQQTLGNVEPIEIQEEMERSFLDYAMSVITARALPDARDGLKPRQRRIIYWMYEQGLRPDRKNQEPSVLPARFPNLLVNGGGGIAVGMATNIPPHNLNEVIDACIYVLDNPDAKPNDLMRFVKGPDFPTGALILGRDGIRDAYRTGRGSIKMRAVTDIEEGRRGEGRIVVTEVPYQTSVEVIGQKIAELVNERKIDGIKDVRNESAGDTTRLVVELRRDANPQVVLNQLYKHTPMQTNFAANVLALVDGVPRILNLRAALTVYVAHQIEVVTRRSEHRLGKARDR